MTESSAVFLLKVERAAMERQILRFDKIIARLEADAIGPIVKKLIIDENGQLSEDRA